MPLEINGRKYFRTSEVCLRVGISRATLFRRLKEGIIDEVPRDRRGWRIFPEAALQKITTESKRIK